MANKLGRESEKMRKNFLSGLKSIDSLVSVLEHDSVPETIVTLLSEDGRPLSEPPPPNLTAKELFIREHAAAANAAASGTSLASPAPMPYHSRVYQPVLLAKAEKAWSEVVVGPRMLLQRWLAKEKEDEERFLRALEEHKERQRNLISEDYTAFSNTSLRALSTLLGWHGGGDFERSNGQDVSVQDKVSILSLPASCCNPLSPTGRRDRAVIILTQRTIRYSSNQWGGGCMCCAAPIDSVFKDLHVHVILPGLSTEPEELLRFSHTCQEGSTAYQEIEDEYDTGNAAIKVSTATSDALSSFLGVGVHDGHVGHIVRSILSTADGDSLYHSNSVGWQACMLAQTCAPFFSRDPPRVGIIEDYVYDCTYEMRDEDDTLELERQLLGGGEFFKLFPRAPNKFASNSPEGIESAYLERINQTQLASVTDIFSAIFHGFELFSGSEYGVRDLAQVDALLSGWQETLTEILGDQQPVENPGWGEGWDY